MQSGKHSSRPGSYTHLNKDDKIMNNLQTLPFESFDKIISLSEGGYISKDKLEIYLSIKKEFALVVSMKITFFDIDKAQGLKQILYKDEIDRRFYDLINTKMCIRDRYRRQETRL